LGSPLLLYLSALGMENFEGSYTDGSVAIPPIENR
jgi:hypothetical protein